LQYQREAEAQLQLDDHQRFVAAPSDDVAAPDLALDLVAAPFEKRLDWRIKCRLAELEARSASGAGTVLLDHLGTSKYVGGDCKAELGGWRCVPSY
jgi:hypothetical protein